jgi:hypothetical protein
MTVVNFPKRPRDPATMIKWLISGDIQPMTSGVERRIVDLCANTLSQGRTLHPRQITGLSRIVNRIRGQYYLSDPWPDGMDQPARRRRVIDPPPAEPDTAEQFEDDLNIALIVTGGHDGLRRRRLTDDEPPPAA